jgi:cellobiose transport system permease protein
MTTTVRGRLFRSRTFHGFLFTAPLLFLFAAFVIYPMVMGVWFALDADAYRALFSDPIFRQTVVNTLWYVGVAVNVKLVLAVLLSGILDYPFRWIRLLAALFLIPWAIPALPGILSFRWMLNSQWGIFNHLLEVFGLPSVPWLAQYWTALGAVMVFHIWKYLPFWTIIFLAGRRAIPNELYEAAAIDGASRWQQFRHVTIPGLRPTILFTIVVSTIGAAQLFGEPLLYHNGLPDGGSSGQYQTLGLLMYQQGWTNDRLGLASATAWTMFLIIVLAVVVNLLLSRRRESNQLAPTAVPAAPILEVVR